MRGYRTQSPLRQLRGRRSSTSLSFTRLDLYRTLPACMGPLPVPGNRRLPGERCQPVTCFLNLT